jgi:hypothetical protein
MPDHSDKHNKKHMVELNKLLEEIEEAVEAEMLAVVEDISGALFTVDGAVFMAMLTRGHTLESVVFIAVQNGGPKEFTPSDNDRRLWVSSFITAIHVGLLRQTNCHLKEIG